LVLVILITFSKPNIFIKGIFFVLIFFQASQLMYFHYFGSFYSAFDLILAIRETTDALAGFWDVSLFLLIPLSISLILSSVAFFLYNKFSEKSLSFLSVNFLLCLVLCFPLLQSLKSSSSQKFQPNITQSAIKNGLYSFSYFIAFQTKKTLGFNKEMPDYEKYQINKIPSIDANIVVIMGESLSTLNMGLYDYERQTTPNLTKLKSDPNFVYRHSLSSAVSTRVSLALFFNTVYEPDNISHLQSMDTSLFRLAKQSGFNTHYITTQKNAGGLTYSFSLKDIDTWKDDSHLNHYRSKYDDRLLLELNEMDLDYSKPQFITLQMRSAHTPYIDNYPKEFEVYPVDNVNYNAYLKNSYDNSVKFNDKVITDIFNFFADTKRPTYIFLTSDHGELTGQNGRFGHNQVDLEIAKVPFLFYGANLTKDAITSVSQELGILPNHYTISKKIAKLLGYEISNPNEKENIYFLNGTAVFGEAGFMSYDIEAQKAKL
jgi:glucan phosphoethanolaminetransferase (alkaline phosphatase superfamily)